MSEQTKQQAPTATMRGSSGAIFVMDLPLSKHMQDQVAKGLLTEVNADGAPLSLAAVAVAKPGNGAHKSDWVIYAVAQGGDRKEVNALSMSELIAMYG